MRTTFAIHYIWQRCLGNAADAATEYHVLQRSSSNIKFILGKLGVNAVAVQPRTSNVDDIKTEVTTRV